MYKWCRDLVIQALSPILSQWEVCVHNCCLFCCLFSRHCVRSGRSWNWSTSTNISPQHPGHTTHEATSVVWLPCSLVGLSRPLAETFIYGVSFNETEHHFLYWLHARVRGAVGGNDRGSIRFLLLERSEQWRAQPTPVATLTQSRNKREKCNCLKTDRMRILLSVLYPVLSITVFGLYPSMVSFPT